MGADGLIRTRKNQIYSFDFKLHMVESYLTTEASYQELALSVGMNNPTLLTKWVNNFRVTSFTRKSRKYNSYKGRIGKIAPNRLHRRFNTNVPHQKITTDTSEFKYYELMIKEE